MLKILRSPRIAGPLSMILLFSFLIMADGCNYFRVHRSKEPPHVAVTQLQSIGKLMILHLDDRAWQFTGISATEDTVSGFIVPLSGHERYKTVNRDGVNRYKVNGPTGDRFITNEVHIYTTGFSQSDSNVVAVPTKEIERIEIYDPAAGATLATFVLGSAAVALSAFGFIVLIVALTKSSCPFVYTDDGNDFLFSGEIFSGATQPGLERDDYLPLNKLRPSGGNYKIRLTNEVKEVQSVNSAGIIVADHPKDLSVLIDKYGTVHSFRNINPPISAVNKSGLNVLPALESKDSLSYSGDMKAVDKKGIEDIYLKFKKPELCDSSKLIIRAKNSFWLDILFGKFHNLLGSRYDSFIAKQESTSPDKLMKFLLDQNIPISVYMQQDGDWKFIDYFNIAGPMALKDDILPIDISKVKSDTVTLKLETGFLFWELDFAGMDFSKDEKIAAWSLTPDEAIAGNGEDVSSMVSSRDKSYFVLKDVGDEVSMTFTEPPQQNTGRSVFLHTSGYYKIIRDQKGPADMKALKSFRKPNRFPAFSKEMYQQVMNK